MSTVDYAITGLTCGHCVNAVSEEVSALPGVTGTEVALDAGGTSTLTVTSEAPVAREDLVAALAEAGDAYVLADD
ncbi:heavy-metal-associated domain-containing protein [Brachybacterium sp. AOP25-B2-12]|uniref:heavy-metal-associated domain-containing protein n=1 Tax=Brachybacterium sp. AOP25-B2-12 TaxID=3457710 RepID=UPI004033F3A4